MQFGSETCEGVDDEDRNCLTRLFRFYMTNSPNPGEINLQIYMLMRPTSYSTKHLDGVADARAGVL